MAHTALLSQAVASMSQQGDIERPDISIGCDTGSPRTPHRDAACRWEQSGQLQAALIRAALGWTGRGVNRCPAWHQLAVLASCVLGLLGPLHGLWALGVACPAKLNNKGRDL
jgi:hypothetical protein